ncbi:hypothetical protein OY671_011693, partial [Metschnikowia pulcherrima]
GGSADQVYQRSEDGRFDFRVSPGGRFTGAGSALRSAVSRTPWRSGSARSEREGFVSPSPRSGWQVRPFDFERFEASYDVRVVSESAAANGSRAEVRDVSEGEARAAAESWMTSSTKEVSPITVLDGRPVGDGKPGPVFHKMYAWYQDFKARVMRRA